MCGICGIFNFDKESPQENILQAMCHQLKDRGPDAQGLYLKDNIALGHRRLSIIDLETGNQPLHNEDGKIQVITNGEIYNYKELRADLEKRRHVFYTRSDAEVIVHLYEECAEKCVQYLRGMFAFALWDGNEEKLFLARDRLGQKPLLYWQDDKSFVFASQFKSILQYPKIKREVDWEALGLYLSFLCVPSPWTMFKGIKKLPPAHYLVVKDATVTIERYWALNFKSEKKLSVDDYKQGLLEHLDEAVRLRLVSDVPLGVFLSGGIDSASVVALMSRHLGGPVKTFSVGFAEKLYNELPYARLIARKFATEHHEIVINPQILDILPVLIRQYGEPFADYSCIPSYYISQFAAAHVKVVLNGDGADETLGGYYRYTAAKLAGIIDFLPGYLKKLIARSAVFLPASKDIRNFTWQAGRFLKHLPYPEKERYLRWVSAFNKQEKESLCSQDFIKLINLDNDLDFLNGLYEKNKGASFLEDVIRAEIETYLPNDLLVKMDIASMANSLEARSPFLDHKFMEFAAQIPLELKIKNLENKFIFKEMLKDLLPPATIKRKKQGFGIPIGSWLRGDLRPLIFETLLDNRALKRPYFNNGFIRGVIDRHLRGEEDNGFKIWTLLMFELWHREFID
ncbi:MAG: asparagine synthase (glutamine-hydrolyzing) [Candidatus Omnitrophica bacterium]|nr:asparagine synthase (glutamine-hydrolyzing) [Candidatus Omnitrophota bacterium]